MRARAYLLAAAVLVTAAAAGARPATAAYSYWGYYYRPAGTTAWTYSNAGPQYRRPPDGGTEGWRWHQYGYGTPQDPAPRSSASFASVCATTAAQEGKKRVAVVVDFDAAGRGVQGFCAVVDERANGSDVMAYRATSLGRPQPRYNSSGLLCSIDGYPESGCGRQVTSPTPKPAATPTRTQPAPTRTASTQPLRPAPGSATATKPTTPAAPATATPSPSPSATPAPGSSTARTTPSAAAPDGTPTLVLEAPDSGQKSQRDSGFPAGTAAGAAVVIAVGAAAAVRARRRS